MDDGIYPLIDRIPDINAGSSGNNGILRDPDRFGSHMNPNIPYRPGAESPKSDDVPPPEPIDPDMILGPDRDSKDVRTECDVKALRANRLQGCRRACMRGCNRGCVKWVLGVFGFLCFTAAVAVIAVYSHRAFKKSYEGEPSFR